MQEIKNLTLIEGDSATLSCKSIGDPPPTMAFQKIGNREEYKNGTNVSACHGIGRSNFLNFLMVLHD